MGNFICNSSRPLYQEEVCHPHPKISPHPKLKRRMTHQEKRRINKSEKWANWSIFNKLEGGCVRIKCKHYEELERTTVSTASGRSTPKCTLIRNLDVQAGQFEGNPLKLMENYQLCFDYNGFAIGFMEK